MQQDQVPQDKENLNEGKVAKLYYATDANGHYVKVNSIGWEPETVAMQQAWDVVHDEEEQARAQVMNGKASPLLYHIKKNIMTYGLLYHDLWIVCIVCRNMVVHSAPALQTVFL